MEEQPEVGGDLEDIPEEEQDQNMLKVPFIRKSYEFSEFFLCSFFSRFQRRNTTFSIVSQASTVVDLTAADD